MKGNFKIRKNLNFLWLCQKSSGSQHLHICDQFKLFIRPSFLIITIIYYVRNLVSRMCQTEVLDRPQGRGPPVEKHCPRGSRWDETFKLHPLYYIDLNRWDPIKIWNNFSRRFSINKTTDSARHHLNTKNGLVVHFTNILGATFSPFKNIYPNF